MPTKGCRPSPTIAGGVIRTRITRTYVALVGGTSRTVRLSGHVYTLNLVWTLCLSGHVYIQKLVEWVSLHTEGGCHRPGDLNDWDSLFWEFLHVLCV